MNTAFVKIWGQVIGAVAWSESNGYATFEFDSKFRANQWVSQHALSINGKRSNITKDDLLVIGKSIKNKKAAETIDEISNTISKWKIFADEAKVSPKLRDEINSTLIKL
jgi:hypothetical protein